MNSQFPEYQNDTKQICEPTTKSGEGEDHAPIPPKKKDLA